MKTKLITTLSFVGILVMLTVVLYTSKTVSAPLPTAEETRLEYCLGKGYKREWCYKNYVFSDPLDCKELNLGVVKEVVHNTENMDNQYWEIVTTKLVVKVDAMPTLKPGDTYYYTDCPYSSNNIINELAIEV